MSDQNIEAVGATETTSTNDLAIEDLIVQLEQLVEENNRLRKEFVRARQAQHKRAALGLGVVGVIAAIAAGILPPAQTVLFVLAGIGVFGAVLTYYLTPERFISASTGKQVYDALSTNIELLVTELGLEEPGVYVPLNDNRQNELVRFFIPRSHRDPLPLSDDLQSLLVIGDDDHAVGVSLVPSGRGLFREFQGTSVDDGPITPNVLADQLAVSLVEVFEITGHVETNVDVESGRASFAITDSAYGPIDKLDHPVVSFLAMAFATVLEKPVTPKVTAHDERSDYLVTCTWTSESPRNR